VEEGSSGVLGQQGGAQRRLRQLHDGTEGQGECLLGQALLHEFDELDAVVVGVERGQRRGGGGGGGG
jgi:hypothetical protein